MFGWERLDSTIDIVISTSFSFYVYKIFVQVHYHPLRKNV